LRAHVHSFIISSHVYAFALDDRTAFKCVFVRVTLITSGLM
jgi:hypothetical protein